MYHTGPSPPAPGPVVLTLISNATVYAPEALGLRHLLIGGGRILWIGESLPTIDDVIVAERIDLDGDRLIPGLIDGHAHVTGGGGESGFASRVPPVGISRFTSAGITAVVGLLGTDDTTRSTQDLVATTYGLREQGLNAWCYTGGYHVPPVTLTGSVRSDIVYLDPVIGVGELALSDHRSSQPTLDELLRVASDAHVAGLTTGKAGIVHLHLGDGERGLSLVRAALDASELPARVFNPTHINRQAALLDEAIDLARRGCYVDITAFPPGDDAATDAALALQRYLASPAPDDRVTMSSDGGGCLPEFNSDGELTRMDVGAPQSLLAALARLLDDGAPLETVVPAFTANPAALLRLPGRGRIAAGNAADLVVLDPQHRCRSVMIGGHWHRRDHQQRSHEYFAEER